MQNILIGISFILVFTSKHFEGLDALACKECPVGTVKNVTNPNCLNCPTGYCVDISFCSPCPPGMYNNITGRDFCLPCTKGTSAADPRSKNCAPCQPGSYQNEEKKQACIGCPSGTSCSNEGCVTCSPCAAGTSSNGRNATKCESCGPGTYSEEGRSLCTLCPPGKFANMSGMSACQQCEPGYVAGMAGSKECRICQPGTRALSGLKCDPCRSGSYCLHPGCPQCELCPPGMYLPEAGSSKPCQACPKETENPFSGSPRCLPCRKGSYSISVNVTRCPPCPEGFYCPTPHDCFHCPEASYCPSGSVEPIQCHGPVMKIDMKSHACIIASEFLAVLIGTVIAIVFFLSVCVFLIWRRLKNENTQLSPIIPTSGENTPLVSRRQNNNTMYTGL